MVYLFFLKDVWEPCSKLHFYFPNFSSGRFISPWKIQPYNTFNCIFISLVAHRILMLCTSCCAVCMQTLLVTLL